MKDKKAKEEDKKVFNVGVIGGGCLGLPLALAFSLKGHRVSIYDSNPERMSYDWFSEREMGPNGEDNFYELLKKSNIKYESLKDMILNKDIYFIVVNTNHPLGHGDKITEERFPYETKHIENLLSEIKDIFFNDQIELYESSDYKISSKDIELRYKDFINAKNLALSSTLTPGQTKKINKKFGVNMLYSPSLPAVSTMVKDILNPEFVLLGVDNKEKNGNKINIMKNFFSTIHDKEVFVTDVSSAELIKVSYNAFISSKIAYINSLMEISEKMGCNIDDVSKCLKLASNRVVSNKYMNPGLSDAGPCHPSGLSALSALGKELNLSFNYFEHMYKSREQQLTWLTELAIRELPNVKNEKIVLLGKSFKAESNSSVGSCTNLLENICKESNVNTITYDPFIYENVTSLPKESSVFLVATNHKIFKNLTFPEGSVILDAWNIIPENKNYTVKKIGRNLLTS